MGGKKTTCETRTLTGVDMGGHRGKAFKGTYII